MKIECIHGYFKFFETQTGQISNFMRLFGFELERSGDHFTFSDLVAAPEYSIAGSPFLNIPAIKTYAGPPWAVMKENSFVYNFALGLVVPIATIVQPIKLQVAGDYMISTGMILPGSIMEDGSRVKDYSAQFISDLMQFRYSEIGT